jgi:hypothetical protein
MIVEALESYAKSNGPLTARFMTERVCAYADHDGRIEALVRRLDSLTEEYGDDYAHELRRTYAAWSELLRSDRALTPVSPPASEGRNEPTDANGEFTRSDQAGERRADVAH